MCSAHCASISTSITRGHRNVNGVTIIRAQDTGHSYLLYLVYLSSVYSIIARTNVFFSFRPSRRGDLCVSVSSGQQEAEKL